MCETLRNNYFEKYQFVVILFELLAFFFFLKTGKEVSMAKTYLNVKMMNLLCNPTSQFSDGSAIIQNFIVFIGLTRTLKSSIKFKI